MSARRAASARARRPATWRTVFGAPLLVGAATLVGLASALFFEGTGWVVSWATLSLPLGLVAWHLWRGLAPRGSGPGRAAGRGGAASRREGTG
ncbi:hypothetical protein OPKNFCMD_4298 [Methylobacterium crusticola]|uniref:DUF4175 domain-containing protein n=1 Tax=Methylobacterium crusticola TaxID=1697972 RepID=A0ABQ4R1W5_9HYPH|nr:hypothetical protein [Methylobacterium crusticola]GJD51543.1 hypothetical protein OPKNFCMD_4298 [Methylobacterium crusticola]